MNFLLLMICSLCLVICITDTVANVSESDDSSEIKMRDILSEITGLRQLVNQESLYRQELERQIRGFRKHLLNDDSNRAVGITGNWNLSGSTDFGYMIDKLDKMEQMMDTKMIYMEQNISQLHFMMQNQMTSLQNLFESFSNLSLHIQEMNLAANEKCLQNGNINRTDFGDDIDNIQTTKQFQGRTFAHTTKSGAESNGIPTTSKGFKSRQYDTGHMGKNFAVMVPARMSGQNMSIYLIISSKLNTQITIRSSYPGISRVFNVTPPGTNLTLPNDFALRQSGGSLVQSRGIILESTEYVSVFVFQYDGYFALPSRYLGTHYKSLNTNHGYSFISIMPYGGCAIVSLTSSRGVSSQTVYIPELSVYYIWSSSQFQNVMISSNQTIALVSGQYKSYSQIKQPIFDSVLPIEAWNKSYIIPYIQNTTYKYDILYSDASTTITAMRNFQTTQESIVHPYRLVRSESYVSNFIQTTDGSFAVVLYYYTGTVFNSFMCIVPSLSQFSNNYFFWTPIYTDNNFLAAIIEEEDSGGIILDNLPIANPYMIHSVCTLDRITYRVLTIAVSHGWHIVKHDDPEVKFGLIMYGGDSNVAYGLPLGLRLD